MACAVFLHVLTHALVQQLAVFSQVHVDEIYDDDSAHVAQAQLACQLVGGSQVGFQGVGFLTVFFLDACSAVHIYHVHGLRMLNNEVGPALVVHGLAERRLQLFGHVEVVKDRHRARVAFDDVGLLGSNECDVVLDLVEDVLVVYLNKVVRGIEQVAQQRNGTAGLFEHQLADARWSFGLS